MPGLLLDLDGTLLDANRSIRETMNQVVAGEGLPTFPASELSPLIGNPLRTILSHRTTDAAAIERMVVRYREVYGESGWVLAEPFPGLPELLTHLRPAWKVGAVTSKGEEEAERVLFDLGLLPLMDAVVGDDDERPLKPDPAPVLEACRRLALPPALAVMVGDTHFDMESGRDAGCQTVGVLWGNGSRESLVAAGATVVVENVAQLRRWLDRWNPEG
ncbi:MAG: HAD family hydrolase [Thermoplasmatota archaeon]